MSGLMPIRSGARGPWEFFPVTVIQTDNRSYPTFGQVPVSIHEASAFAWRVKNWKLTGTLTYGTPSDDNPDPPTITFDDWDLVTQPMMIEKSGPEVIDITESQLVTAGAPVVKYAFYQCGTDDNPSIGDPPVWNVTINIPYCQQPYLQSDQLFLPDAYLQIALGGSAFLNASWLNEEAATGVTFALVKIGTGNGINSQQLNGDSNWNGSIILTGDNGGGGFFGWNGIFDPDTGIPF